MSPISWPSSLDSARHLAAVQGSVGLILQPRLESNRAQNRSAKHARPNDNSIGRSHHFRAPTRPHAVAAIIGRAGSLGRAVCCAPFWILFQCRRAMAIFNLLPPRPKRPETRGAGSSGPTAARAPRTGGKPGRFRWRAGRLPVRLWALRPAGYAAQLASAFARPEARRAALSYRSHKRPVVRPCWPGWAAPSWCRRARAQSMTVAPRAHQPGSAHQFEPAPTPPAE